MTGARDRRAAGKRGHHLLSQLSGAPGDLIEAKVGHVYLANTMLWQSNDPAPSRPVLVLDVPSAGRREIRVATRTSDLDREGVFQPADTALGLDQDGVWADMRYVDKDRWREGQVSPKGGPLDPDLLAEIQAWFA